MLLALPEVVARLHTSISHVVWVIVVYNLALIAGSLAIRFTRATRLPVEPMLVAGLALFGAASLAAGLVSSLTGLLVARGFQGAGGAVLLCASLPPMARAARAGTSPLRTWSAAAAIGAAIGPAAGGVLTQLFDWRAIFIAQAPVAALAAVVVWWIARTEPEHPDFADPVPADERTEGTAMAGSLSGAIRANVALMLLSAGLIGALFLSTLLLINVWGLSPIGAAAVLLVLPLLTAATGRLARGSTPTIAAAGGAVAVAVGVGLLALPSDRSVIVCIVALALSGVGLGVSFSALTEEALSTGPTMLARVANTIAARDLGLVIGLLALTPIFVAQIGHVQSRAQPPLTKTVLASGMPIGVDLQLAVALEHAAKAAPQSQLPDLGPSFRAIERLHPEQASILQQLEPQAESIVRSTATKAFHSSLLGAAGFAVLAAIVVLLGLLGAGERERAPDTVIG